MPAFGGLSPYPRRLGGRRPPAEAILRDLNAARGTAYDTSPGTSVYIENLAYARAIAAAFATNDRLSNQIIPLKMTSALPRWERIMKIIPARSTPPAARRRAVHDALARAGQETVHATLYTALANAVGEVFVALEYIDHSIATIHVPDGTYPFGTVSEGVPWSSTTQHILAKLQRPTGYTEADFYEAAGKVSKILDDALPSDATFAWYRAPEVGAPINVVGGPSEAGFYLDERNLDSSVFDV